MTNKQKSVNIVDGLQVHNLTNFIKKIYLPFYFDKVWSVEILPTFCTLVKNMQVECSHLLEPNTYECPIRTIRTYWAEILIFD